uniref:C2 domain-containing protein n=1 Tax=Mesocestoides corti TaxID=53468 RepID=A0A5K3FM47_MESCO
MFRKKPAKTPGHSKGHENDPFRLDLDPNELQFDEAALEKELAAMLGSDKDEEKPLTKAIPSHLSSQGSGQFRGEPVTIGGHGKGHKDESFRLDLDPSELEFDDAALEKELAATLGNDTDKEGPKTRETHPRRSTDLGGQVSEDEMELLSSLKTHLGVSDNESEVSESAKTPSNVPTVPSSSVNETLAVILERQKAFEDAISSIRSSADALTDTENACLRRYERMLASVKSMAAKAKCNISVNLEDLPAAPPTPKHTSTEKPQRKTGENIVLDYVTGTTSNTKTTTSSESPPEHIRLLKERLAEYRRAAALAKTKGNKLREKELMVAVDALAGSIPLIESGVEQFDPADMPPPPEQFSLPPEALAELSAEPQSGTSTAPAPPQPVDPAMAAIAKAASSTVATKESLTARIQLLNAMIQSSDASNKRLYERTHASYVKALRALETGVRFNYGQLNPLPGCPQFTSAAPPAGAAAAATSSSSSQPAPSSSSSARSRTLELLKQRQAELRTAAAHAKARGDMNEAREYLRLSLGMNNMIRSVGAGLPIDFKQVPPAPHSGKGPASGSPSQPILSGVACAPPVEFQTALVEAGKDSQAICDKLIWQLEAQATEASRLSESLREAGLSQIADKIFDLADVSRKWIALTTAYKHRSRVPQYSFEMANLPCLNMNPDLGDGVLEVTAVRGISLPVPPGVSSPSSLDTYVTIELPFPSSDSPQKHSTEWARHTNEPTDYGGYQASARFEVNRHAKSYERLLQGVKSIKATVYYNRGLLKKPGVLGAVTVKLNDLMTSATHTASYDLMDGRKAVGGRLELRMRHRAPLQGPKFRSFQKPWLCISDTKKKPSPQKK